MKWSFEPWHLTTASRNFQFYITGKNSQALQNKTSHRPRLGRLRDIPTLSLCLDIPTIYKSLEKSERILDYFFRTFVTEVSVLKLESSFFG
jgi:hypothetical protein